MSQSAILALAIVFSSVLIVSGTNICDKAPCEPQINASVAKEFTISLESDPSTGFEWWTKFDPNYLTLLNSTFINGKKSFTFNARSAGNTEVTMLLLEPWQNGAIAERKIFPIIITSERKPATSPKGIVNLETTAECKTIPISAASAAAALKQTAGSTISNGQTMIHLPGNLPTSFPNESVMETPSQVIPPRGSPNRYELSSLIQKSI